jgi:hypothetical protein
MKTILPLFLLVGCAPVVPSTQFVAAKAPKTYCEQLASWVPEEVMAKHVFKQSWNAKNLNPELNAIAWQESYFNTNLDHEKSPNGPYHTAFGPLGFKPSTAHLEYKASKVLQQKYPGLASPRAFLKKFIFTPVFYNELANAHWNRLKKQAGGETWKAAFAWRWGPGAMAKATQEEIMSDEYVTKYASRNSIELQVE